MIKHNAGLIFRPSMHKTNLYAFTSAVVQYGEQEEFLEQNKEEESRS